MKVRKSNMLQLFEKKCPNGIKKVARTNFFH